MLFLLPCLLKHIVIKIFHVKFLTFAFYNMIPFLHLFFLIKYRKDCCFMIWKYIFKRLKDSGSNTKYFLKRHCYQSLDICFLTNFFLLNRRPSALNKNIDFRNLISFLETISWADKFPLNH